MKRNKKNLVTETLIKEIEDLISNFTKEDGSFLPDEAIGSYRKFIGEIREKCKSCKKDNCSVEISRYGVEKRPAMMDCLWNQNLKLIKNQIQLDKNNMSITLMRRISEEEKIRYEEKAVRETKEFISLMEKAIEYESELQ